MNCLHARHNIDITFNKHNLVNRLWKFLSCNVVILRVRMATKRTVAKEIGIPRNQEFTKNILKKTIDQSSLHLIMWKYCSGCKD